MRPAFFVACEHALGCFTGVVPTLYADTPYMSTCKRFPLLLTLLLLAASWGQATPLRLDYSKSWSASGIVYYTFTLALENSDDSWAPGQGWGWLIFGDSPTLGGSAFNDFTLTGGVFGVGPWTEVTTSSGAHNGPTLGPVTDFWVPNNVGDFITWQGYSTSNVPDGALFFSTFFTQGGGVAADFAAANNLFPDELFPNSPGYVPPINGGVPPTTDSGSSSSSSSSGGSSSSSSSSSGSSSSSSSSSGGDDPLFIQTVSTPEPGTMVMAGLALLALGWKRSRSGHN